MSLFWRQIVLLTLLSSFLIFKQLQREWLRARDHGNQADWACAGFDASPLQSRIQQLRKNYSEAIPARTPRGARREKVVDSIRQTIKRLEYFHPTQFEASAVDPQESSRGQT